MTDERRDAEDQAAEAFSSPPAPVVTDEGVYGTLPRVHSYAEYEGEAVSGRHPLLPLVTALLVLSAGLWLIVLSAAQVTSETVALPTIERGIESLTGLRAHLTLNEEEIRRTATAAPTGDQPVPIAGFEVAGVSLSRTEILEGTPGEWHSTLRDRAARAIYVHGIEVLAASGTSTDGGAFSASGALRLLMETLSESRHSLASFLVLPLSIAVAIATAGVLAFGRGFGRFQALGFAVAVASLGAIASGILGLAVLALVGGGSALADETHAMASAVVGVPLRNGLTALFAGVAVGLAGRVLGAIFRVHSPERDITEDGLPAR